MTVELIYLALAMIVAIILGLTELFLLPGTIAGIAGSILAAGGLYYAYGISLLVGNITLVSSAIVFIVGVVWFMHSRSINKMALHADVDSRLESSKDLGIQVGDRGITLSRLASIGKARIGGRVVEAQSDAGLIDENTPVVVVQVTGCNVVVHPQKSDQK